MPISETLTAVPDQILDTLTTTQGLFLATLESVTDRVTPWAGKVRESGLTDQVPDAVTVVDSAYTVAERFLANQRAFSIKLLEAWHPAAGVTPVGTKVA